MGNDFCKEVASENSADENPLLISLTGLQARGCEIASEVFVLLKNGFPDGAHARWRTLYEMSVIATFISENGDEAAKRYLHHDLIESTRGIQDYQKYCTVLGYEPFSEEKIAGMKKDRDDLIHSFGEGFKEDYGWASDILRKKNSPLEIQYLTAQAASLTRYTRPGPHVSSPQPATAPSRAAPGPRTPR